MAVIPTSEKSATKGAKPSVAAPAKPATARVVENKILAEPPLAKPAVAIPVIVTPTSVSVRNDQPVKAEVSVAGSLVKVAAAAAPAAVVRNVELPGVEAAEIEEPKVEAVPIAPAKAQTSKIEAVKPKPKTAKPAAAPILAAVPMKGNIMNDTIKTATADMQQRATVMFGDMNNRAKDAMSKSTKAIEDLVEFSKGNVEAMVASGRVAAKGAEEIAKYSAECGRSAVEKANAAAKQFAAVKSPTEFFQLQGDVAKQTLDALVAEGAKFTESYLKLIGEISQPISNRLAVAAEKVKTTIAI